MKNYSTTRFLAILAIFTITSAQASWLLDINRTVATNIDDRNVPLKCKDIKGTYYTDKECTNTD